MTEERFKTLWREEYVRLYHVAFSILREPETSKDVVSQAFADLLEKDIHGKTDDYLRWYLFKTVSSRCLDNLKHQKVENRFIEQSSHESMQETLDALEREWQLEAVREFVDNNMPTQAARAIRLCYDKGLTHQQAADEMHISLSALNKNLARGLEALRKRFKTNM